VSRHPLEYAICAKCKYFRNGGGGRSSHMCAGYDSGPDIDYITGEKRSPVLVPCTTHNADGKCTKFEQISPE